MDFHSLLRRDLQFLCKRNKIPANMTNVAMADALKALEIVEGLDEYMNQSISKAPQSPTSVAKQPPITATKTTRRNTTVKAEPQSSSQLVTGSCRLTSKSLAGEMDQENINKNVVQELKTNNVPKTPAARTTRKASAAISCSSKVQESKKGELVQSVYSTRRSTRLLEKCMADLSLKTRETLEKPARIEETEQKVSAQEENPAGSEVEVIPGRDLNASMEQVWENLKNDNDQVAGDLEIYVDLGDTVVSDANTETKEEKMNEVAESDNSLVQVDKQEEMLPAICEEGQKKNGNDEEIEDQEIYVDLGDNIETHNDDKESKNVQAFNSLAPVNQQETELAIKENDFEPEKLNSFDEETMVDQTVSVAGDSKTEHAIQENDSEPEKITNLDEDYKTDSDAGDSETEAEEDDSGVDSDGTFSEADSNQAVMGSDIADEEINLSESEASSAAPASPPLLLAEAEVKTTPLSPLTAEPISVQFPRPSKPTTTPSKNSALKLVNENKENNVEMMMNVKNNENGESKGEEGKKKKKVTIDEENLKDVSMRQLVKMVKELSIKSSNRTALQILPANNQTAE
ncbi:hypothetical protein V5N11_030712 [Cardamine amara subsp. amara]|uniref:Uncharacterized protein n=1 Tax=Cardamine amara subsp. amara TaxID=228776 RepID=A0ABD0ZLA3_CARAN